MRPTSEIFIRMIVFYLWAGMNHCMVGESKSYQGVSKQFTSGSDALLHMCLEPFSCPADSSPHTEDSTECVCDAGFEGPDGGTCTQCEAGKFKDVTGSAACEACPASSDSPAGSISSTACACDVGFTGPNGGTCTQCEAGQFKDVTGSAACETCSANSHSPAVGSISSTACTCDKGFTGPNGGTCTQCQDGEFKDATGSAACSICPASSDSPTGSTSSTNCACDMGFTGPNGGTCTQCAVGTFKEADGSAPCNECPTGSTSAPGSTQLWQYECSPGLAGRNSAGDGSHAGLSYRQECRFPGDCGGGPFRPSLYAGSVLADNGIMYFVPSSSETIGRYDPVNDILSFIEISAVEEYIDSNGDLSTVTTRAADPNFPSWKHGSVDGYRTNNGWKWSVGVQAPNGNIYFIPQDMSVISILNTSTDIFSITVRPYHEYKIVKYHGAVMALNGNLYMDRQPQIKTFACSIRTPTTLPSLLSLPSKFMHILGLLTE